MPPVTLAAIPWRFQDTAVIQRWTWRTAHFDATVSTEGAGMYWTLGDLVVPNQDQPRFLAEGMAADLPAAEEQVREMVGKCYPPAAGYGPYVGTLATTFTLATGARVDLGEFDGQQVIVHVRLAAGGTRTVAGRASVVHHELHVTADPATVLSVLPGHVESIVPTSGPRPTSMAGSSPRGRIHRGDRTSLCTGRAGFEPGTVDHAGQSLCPVHERIAHR